MHSRNPPRNCAHAFSADGDQVFTNKVWTAEQSRANFFFRDVEEEIRSAAGGHLVVGQNRYVVARPLLFS